jgi:hypothetical protein
LRFYHRDCDLIQNHDSDNINTPRSLFTVFVAQSGGVGSSQDLENSLGSELRILFIYLGAFYFTGLEIYVYCILLVKYGESKKEMCIGQEQGMYHIYGYLWYIYHIFLINRLS